MAASLRHRAARLVLAIGGLDKGRQGTACRLIRDALARARAEGRSQARAEAEARSAARGALAHVLHQEARRRLERAARTGGQRT